MIIKIILNKVYFHPLFILVSFICAITGHFREFTIFFLIIIIHELGHIVGGLYYNWKLEKIIVLPFGGLTIFNQRINCPLKQELIVTLLGPVFQIMFYFLCTNLFYDNVILTKYHYPLLLFNLIPIIPLDGSKLLNVLLNKIFNFKKSHIVNIILSGLVTIFLITIIIYKNYGLIYILIFLFIAIKILREIKQHKQLINKFILERYLYPFRFKKTKLLKNKELDNMYKDHYHFFYIKNNLYSEDELLRKRFDFKRKV